MLPVPSASEVATLWRYTNVFIIVIITGWAASGFASSSELQVSFSAGSGIAVPLQLLVVRSVGTRLAGFDTRCQTG